MSEATRTPNPLVEQFLKGSVPRDLRVLAAQGALPLKVGDLLELLEHLRRDPEADISGPALQTMIKLAPAEVLPVFKERETPPAILAWALVHRSEADLRGALLQNPTTPDAAVQDVAPRLPESLVELVVINQVRLLRSTPLLEATESNSDLNKDQRRRLRELRETFRIGEAPAPEQAPPPPPAPEPAQPEEEAVVEPPVLITPDEAIAHYLTEEERGEADKISTVQRIYRMTIAEKVILALKGTREERNILIRDPNRLVASAVLGSPRLTDAEVEAFAAMKNVSEDVLRRVGSNRDWIKRYPVLVHVVKNPRTPVGVAIGLVARLNPRDMKSTSIDRNVPDVIRKTALRFIRQTDKSGGAKRA